MCSERGLAQFLCRTYGMEPKVALTEEVYFSGYCEMNLLKFELNDAEGEIGPDLFRHACLMGLEGLVSKHRESPYHGGRFDRWVKVKHRAIRRSAG